MNSSTAERTMTLPLQQVDIERSLNRYAYDLEVSLDYVILASLKMVADDYSAARARDAAAMAATLVG